MHVVVALQSTPTHKFLVKSKAFARSKYTVQRHIHYFYFLQAVAEMGSIFGKETVPEPAHNVLLERHGPNVGAAYELRRYGERFAAETSYGPKDKDDSPFMLLAGYIGVFGNPQNEGNEAISMTAPVVIQDKGTAISMTAPVVIKNDHTGSPEEKTMQFILPAEYDSISKIPRPTNPKVHIRELPPAVGAVHRFSGSVSLSSAKQWATKLAYQLQADGLDDLTKEYVLENYQFWGYNPPYTIPIFRRNEVWIALTQDQADRLIHDFGGAQGPN
jgi:hypothetical protein